MNGLHQLLVDISKEFSARSYLEIGCCEGASLQVVIDHHKFIKDVVIIDPWGSGAGGTDRGSHDHINPILKDLGINVQFYDDLSQNRLASLISRTFDLITIDGGHTYNEAMHDLFLAWELLSPHGWIVFDDIYHPQHQYLKRVADIFYRMKPVMRSMENDEPYGAIAFMK